MGIASDCFLLRTLILVVVVNMFLFVIPEKLRP